MQPTFMTAGHFVDGFYTDAYGTRAYKLYIPSGYTGQALPLLVLLHGCAQDPDEFAAGTSSFPVFCWKISRNLGTADGSISAKISAASAAGR